MKTETLVSIIIPTYNRAGTLSRAIDSALGQYYKNIEIIVVDDGSTDHTAQLLVPYSEQIIYIRQDNQGQAAARNAGLKKATGAFVASLDSDDEWKPDFLSKCVSKMETDKLDFVFTNWSQQTKEGHWIDSFSRYYFLDEFKPLTDTNGWIDIRYEDLRRLYLKYCPSPSSSIVIRKSAMVQGWNSEMNVADDWCLQLDVIFSRTCKVAYTNDILWQKGINDNNICDGRNVVELARFLYIADIKNLMKRFRKMITPREYRTFEIVYIENLIKLGSYHMLREHNIFKGLQLWQEAVLSAPGMTLKGIGNIIVRKTLRGAGRKQKEIR